MKPIDQQEEWGPWINHDGNPTSKLAGNFVHVITEVQPGKISETKLWMTGGTGKSWDWSYRSTHTRVIRYRIRKPRGLTILQGLIADAPQEVMA